MDISTRLGLRDTAYCLLGERIEKVVIEKMNIRLESYRDDDYLQYTDFKVRRVRDNVEIEDWIPTKKLFKTRDDLIACL